MQQGDRDASPGSQDGADPLPPHVFWDTGKEAAAWLDRLSWLPEEKQLRQTCSHDSLASVNMLHYTAVGESSSSNCPASPRKDKSPPPDMLEIAWAAQKQAILQDTPPKPTLWDVFMAVQSCNSSLLREDMSIICQDVQKVRERTSALEGRVGSLEYELAPVKRDVLASMALNNYMVNRIV